MNFFLLLLISLIWGSSFILIKKASVHFPPASLGAYRMLLGAVTLAIIWKFSSIKSGWEKKYIPLLLLLSATAYVIPFLIQPFLISRYDSGFISLIVSLIPLITVIISIPMLKKLPNRFELMGVTGGFLCLLILFKDGLDRSISLKHLLLWLLVPLCYSIGNTLVKMKFQSVHPLAASCLALSMSGTALFPVSITRDVISTQGSFLQSLIALIFLGVICTGFATALFYILIYRAGPVSAGMVAYIIPFLALFWGWVDGESLSIYQFLALAGILVMVWLTQKQPEKTKRQFTRVVS
ncbi:MAG: DMT family transporter [Fibrobacteria bacterium]|nr:DMT family transporter [Fibrobacteria bacterium]